MDWNNLKVFLTLVRKGNVRSAAEDLQLSHSTVARRIESLEVSAGTKLLARQSGGYQLTPAGEDMMAVAETMELEIQELALRITGKDQQLSGTIRISMIDIVATHLIMPVLATFTSQYPDIDLQLDITYEAVDLNKQDADLALRFARRPPEHLIADKIGQAAVAVYAHKDYLNSRSLDNPKTTNWIGYGEMTRFPKWLKRTPYPHLPAKGNFESMLAQLAAVKAMMGLGLLPCFLCDPEPGLIQLTRPETADSGFNLWLFRHPGTRTTARIKALSEAIRNTLQNTSVLAGLP